ncbi:MULTISPECIES: hypothetical protein [Methylobacterium]|uniref:Uncharacterized protein n=1 Tax=Methylobacterium jeotgali TaxID=381630 RepID=A0ABQ4SVQ9_9HYPH|nr:MULTISPECIES: hypothetical protein [Methylobacterium]PIU04577.1 MAG: hypothetical protein COT56_19610 [Methylobacterium sp. CG09_land_8_20_14_0_10_71_15]PIU13846.1 MAG: hypothetical protein COT28_09840 [Methylobacterium sp. CG08_land_8_20_14_0_20_71_15]GBU16177.1 hypothetical protein AwMethylo_03920 [Methylobacterium sp.]GJE05889.1 hypothetical protein AOPFMNJM_1195 [Methylobacterium jeotgali]
MAERLPETDARQGSKGKPMLFVLITSLLLLGIATAGLLTWQGTKSPNDYASRSQDAARGEVTGSVSGQPGSASTNSSNVPAGNPAYPSPAQPKTGAGTERPNP